MRNPWRFSFDRKSGDLFIADVGQDKWEEVDYLAHARLAKVVNYGWSVYEGSHSYKPSEPLNRRGKLVRPVSQYGHVNGNCAIAGGYVYRGSSQPALRGRYFFGDNCSGAIWSLKVRKGKAVGLRRESITVPALSSFGQDSVGEIYALSMKGPVYRIT